MRGLPAARLLFALSLLATACRSRGDGANRQTSGNGLLVAHFPDGFRAESRNDNLVVLSRRLNAREDEAIALVSLPHPVSTDIDDFGPRLIDAEAATFAGYQEQSRSGALCLGEPGIEVRATWRHAESGATYRRWSCAFVRNGHGYSLSYIVREERAAAEEPYLRRIIDATELTD